MQWSAGVEEKEIEMEITREIFSQEIFQVRIEGRVLQIYIQNERLRVERRIIVYLTKPDKNLDLVGKCLNAYCRISCSLDSVSNHDRSYVGEMKNK